MTKARSLFDLPHVASRIFGTPLAVAKPKVDAIIAAIGSRLGVRVEAQGGPFEKKTRKGISVTQDGIACIEVLGTLVRRLGPLDAESGMSSYGQIGSEFEKALGDHEVRGIVLLVDSPGGEVGGLFQLVSKLKLARGQKPVYAVAEDDAYSAAYAIASSAERIYVSPHTGGVGSVGVVALHVDQSRYDSKRGLSFEYVYAGAKKVDGNPHEPLSDGARSDLQAEVDRLYDLFVTTVSENRNVDAASIRATEAGLYSGDKAIAEGLADKVGGVEQAIEDMRAELAKPKSRRNTMDLSKAMREQLGLSAEATDDEVLAAITSSRVKAAAGEKLASELAQVKEEQAAAREREKTRARALVEEKVDGLRAAGKDLGIFMTDDERSEVVEDLASDDPRRTKSANRLLDRFRAQIDAGKKVAGAKPRENPNLKTEDTKAKAEADKAHREAMEPFGWKYDVDKETGLTLNEYAPGMTTPYKPANK